MNAKLLLEKLKEHKKWAESQKYHKEKMEGFTWGLYIGVALACTVCMLLTECQARADTLSMEETDSGIIITTEEPIYDLSGNKLSEEERQDAINWYLMNDSIQPKPKERREYVEEE